MTASQNRWVIALTVTYLCFELAFNARLLDVVGGTADQEQIHHIEIFGRSLSGIAIALFALQGCLLLRNRSMPKRPGGMLTLLVVAATAVTVYALLNLLVDTIAERSSASFRRASYNIVLVQRAMVLGRVELDGLTDDPTLFRQPAGKAFLAQFPGMATSIDGLDEKISNAKLTLISRVTADALGQAGGFYKDKYVKAVEATQEKWRRYSKAPAVGDLDSEIARQQDKAWSEYVSDLGRRGWTPSTVPGMAHRAVLRKVRARVPVPANWNLSDEATFREAVAAKVRQRAGGAAAKAPVVHGQKLPMGLSWPAFFAQPGVQAELRDRLHLPAGIALQPAYSTGAEFQQKVFDPMVQRLAREKLARYDAPVEDFADGGKLAKEGREAARSAIVPPLALFFSFVGALLHCMKLMYLAIKTVLASAPRLAARIRYAWPIPFAVGAAGWIALSFMDNAVTESRLFGYMRQQIIAGAEPTTWPGLKRRAIANSLHVVSVGQDRFYPTFEFIRVQVLGGITYGYEEHVH